MNLLSVRRCCVLHTVQLLVSLFEYLGISFNFFLCFTFHLRGNARDVVPAVLLTSPQETIEVSFVPC